MDLAWNEGNLDAINTWDNAFLSFGLFQWTAGTGSGKGELPALLARIKNEDRDLFDKYCGQHGLDVVNADMSSIAQLEENVAAVVSSPSYFA